jgi:esterase/lipase
MLFVNPVLNHHSRLLYIMGATWHTKCMFDLETHEPSFAKLLNQQCIETYAVDIIGSGPGLKNTVIGDQYQNTLDLLQYIVEQYKIDHVMGYSTGCVFAVDLLKKYSFKKIILLDPGAQIKISRQVVNDDKYVISKEQVYDILKINEVNVDAWTLADHVNSLSYSDELVTAAWPIAGNYLNKISQKDIVDLKGNNNVKLFFTKHSLPDMREVFGSQGVFLPHASHWVLIEPGRRELATDVAEFIKYE